MTDNWREESERFAVHSDDVRESFKLAFDSVKHLMTLSGAVLAVFATFLHEIFPSNLDTEVKVLIGLSFVLLILSLVFSTFSLWRVAGLVRSRRQYEKKKKRIRWNILLPSLTFTLGLSCFGTAVLLNVLFDARNLGANERGKYIVYAALGTILAVVVAWVIYRIVLGNRRDAEGKYEVMYPFVKDYDELVAREMPEKAFTKMKELKEEIKELKDGMDDGLGENTLGDELAHQRISSRTQLKTFDLRQQVYAELLSLTHPHKLVDIGSHVSIDFFDFRDTANKLEAHITLMAPTDVRETVPKMVNSFADCVVAREKELSAKRRVEELKDSNKSGQKVERKKSTKQQKQLEEREQERQKREADFNKKFTLLLHTRNEFVEATQKDLNPV